MIPVLLASLFAGLASSPSAQRKQATPPQADMIYVDSMGPPATMQEMWNSVALVVRGRVEASGRPEQPPSSGMPVVKRPLTVRLLEVLKGPSSVAADTMIRVLQYGGTVEVGGREVNTQYPVDLLEPGEDSVFFLVPASNGAYEIAYGRSGLFKITDDGRSVKVPDAVKRMPTFANRGTMSAEELLDILRSYKAGRGR